MILTDTVAFFVLLYVELLMELSRKVMDADREKDRDQLLAELVELRRQVADMEKLRSRLASAEAELRTSRLHCREREEKLDEKCAEHQAAIRDLQLARVIVARSPVILFRRVAGEEAQLEYVSENLRRFGYTPDEFLTGSMHFRDIVYPDDRQRVSREIHQYAEADVEEYTMIYRCVTRDGQVRWVEDQTSVVRDETGRKTHNQGILFDITERRLAEEALRKSEEKYRRIVETAAEGFYLLDQEFRVVDVNGAYCRLSGYSREELLGTVITDRVTEEFRQFLRYNKDKLLAQEYREVEVIGVTKDGRQVPLLVHGNTLRDDQGEVIGQMAFITDMTAQKKALALAGEVQKSLLPQEGLKIPGLDIAGRNVSCDEIGGDYYDFIVQRNSTAGPLSVVVGDISGHGVDSALLMATARAFLRMRASQPGTVAEVVSAMNSHLSRDVLDSGRFMTLFFLTIDPARRQLSWVRAGHDPAILYDPFLDSFEELKGQGIALGVKDEVGYMEQQRENLRNGQIVAIGTDGIWEAFNIKGEMFGKERLKACIRRYASCNASEILSRVYGELASFTVGRRSEDDITLVVIKLDGLAPL